jgi:hypothetical protein
LPGEALFDFAEKVTCDLLGVGIASVLETDRVGERRVTEEDAGDVLAFYRPIGLAEDIRVVNEIARGPR